uniref:hypothetical protein n=1 Tax=Burkholderia sp. M701 TaxID=326454 RepID=UPI0012EB15B2|nr:hypothetical protein [Burkholderia sp. M701]
MRDIPYQLDVLPSRDRTDRMSEHAEFNGLLDGACGGNGRAVNMECAATIDDPKHRLDRVELDARHLLDGRPPEMERLAEDLVAPFKGILILSLPGTLFTGADGTGDQLDLVQVQNASP